MSERSRVINRIDEFNMYIEKRIPKLLKKYVQILKNDFNENLISVVLFGSAARKTMKQNSDIDILLVIDPLPKSAFKRIEIIRESESKLSNAPEYIYFAKFHAYGSPFNYVIFDRQEAMKNHYLYLDLIDEAIVFYDKGNFFIRKLREFKKRITQLGAKRFYLPDGTWYWDIKPDLKLGEEFEL
jgi:predicted nucleotidyltransferase